MSETPDFLKAVQRMQVQIDHLLDQGRDVTWDSFNEYLAEIKHYWLEKEALSKELQSRIEALAPLNVNKKIKKYSALRRFTLFGDYAADQFAKGDLDKELIWLRNQLASIEFIYKMES
jgi:hypothetical protein